MATLFERLLGATSDWLDRDDLNDYIPDFVTMAEMRIARRLRVSEMETTATTLLQDGKAALPPDFEEIRYIYSAAEGAYPKPLQPLAPGQAGGMYASSQAGVPIHYTIAGGYLTTYPNGGDGQITMIYYARPPALDIYGTNWLIVKAFDLYLFGACLEGALFQKDMEEAAAWEARFNEAIERLQAADQKSRYANSVSRVRGPTP